MRMLIRYSGGQSMEGVLLHASWGKMRVALRDCGDTVELRSADGAWYVESGSAVEIEALMAVPGIGVADRFESVPAWAANAVA
jgi:hypothetical protein